MALHLGKDAPRTLAYGSHLQKDLKLLEVSEDLLEELQTNGYVDCMYSRDQRLPAHTTNSSPS